VSSRDQHRAPRGAIVLDQRLADPPFRAAGLAGGARISGLAALPDAAFNSGPDRSWVAVREGAEGCGGRATRYPGARSWTAAAGGAAVVGLALAWHRGASGGRRRQRAGLPLLALRQRRPGQPTTRPVDGPHATSRGRRDPVLRALRLPAVPAVRGRRDPRPSRTWDRRLPAQSRPPDPARLLGDRAADRRRPPSGAAPRRRLRAPGRLARRAAGHAGQESPVHPELRSADAADRHRTRMVAGDRDRLLPRATGDSHAGHRARPTGRKPAGTPSGGAGAPGRHAPHRAVRQAGRAPRRPGHQRWLGGRLAFGARAQLPGQCRPVRLRDGARGAAHRRDRRRGQPAEMVAGRRPDGGCRGGAPRRERHPGGHGAR
jgi:hypothetical protein